MSFTAIIWQTLAKTFDYKSQASKAEYWYFALFTLLLSVVLGVVDSLISKAISSRFSTLELVAGVALLLPQTALTARRFHDAGFSAKWLFLQLLPIAAFVYAWPQLSFLLRLRSEPTEAQLMAASTAFAPLFLSSMAVAIFVLVITLLPTKTYAGGNRYAKPSQDDVALEELRNQGW